MRGRWLVHLSHILNGDLYIALCILFPLKYFSPHSLISIRHVIYQNTDNYLLDQIKSCSWQYYEWMNIFYLRNVRKLKRKHQFFAPYVYSYHQLENLYGTTVIIPSRVSGRGYIIGPVWMSVCPSASAFTAESSKLHTDYNLKCDFVIPPYNRYLEFGDATHKRVVEFSDPPHGFVSPLPAVVNGHSLIFWSFSFSFYFTQPRLLKIS